MNALMEFFKILFLQGDKSSINIEVILFVGYLTPNPFLNKWTVLFWTIQFSISTQFVKNTSISNRSVYSNSSNSASF